MSLISHAAFLAAVRAEGVTVKEHTIGGKPWYENYRPASTGSWDPNGQADHHTGPFSSVLGMVDLCFRGRSDLPGPICHGTIDPTGVLHMVGWGRANHLGLVAANFVDALRADALPMGHLLVPGQDVVDGNARTYGWEVMHPGDSSAYPAKQIDALVRVNTAVCRAHHWTAASVGHHKESTHRKGDMSYKGAGGYVIRTMVHERLQHAPSWTPGVVPAPLPVPVPAPVPVPHVASKWVYGTAVADFRAATKVELRVAFPSAGFTKPPALVVTPERTGIHPYVVGRPTSAEGKIGLAVIAGKPWTGRFTYNWIAIGE